MSDSTVVAYPVKDVDQVVRSDQAQAVETRPGVGGFGTWHVDNYASVTGFVTNRQDLTVRYVTVRATVAGSVQLGSSVDGNSSLPLPANIAVTLPAQGYHQVSVNLASSGNLVIVWHDELIRIWST